MVSALWAPNLAIKVLLLINVVINKECVTAVFSIRRKKGMLTRMPFHKEESRKQ